MSYLLKFTYRAEVICLAKEIKERYYKTDHLVGDLSGLLI